ncbi:MAG: ABC transporter ATP-binding protein, partial [Desulfobulbaceae bacterium]|nr:ABC transporter ATP-binding protein [Desulfobulbaceae bacterium]
MHLIRTFFTAYPRQSVMTLAALLLAGVAEGFGLSMLLPLLGLTIAGTGAAAGVALPAPSAL